MCGRYALALRPSQVRVYLENEHMPVFDAPEDEGHNAPRQSYNFAPGYSGIVYRADVPDHGAGSEHSNSAEQEPSSSAPPTQEISTQFPSTQTSDKEVRYKLQAMKWSLIPFWTKRNPDYSSMMKTMNCRDDSLIENKGMWTTMKQRKRCIVIAQGFYEWLKRGKEKVPHYIKRKDGKLMCMAGLWDCVQYEGEEQKLYTYTIITTSSNKQLNFLHDRMPCILENGSKEIRTWLDPGRTAWTKELQSLLRPFEGELEVYPVSKEVGKVGNNSPNFIIPVASSENKSNIANFFAKGAAVKKESGNIKKELEENRLKKEELRKEDFKKEDIKEVIKKEVDINPDPTPIKHESSEDDHQMIDHNGTEDNAPLPIPKSELKSSIKRELDDVLHHEPPKKAAKLSASPSKTSSSPSKPVRKTRSATSNNTTSPSKAGKDKGSQKITSFFGK